MCLVFADADSTYRQKYIYLAKFKIKWHHNCIHLYGTQIRQCDIWRWRCNNVYNNKILGGAVWLWNCISDTLKVFKKKGTAKVEVKAVKLPENMDLNELPVPDPNVNNWNTFFLINLLAFNFVYNSLRVSHNDFFTFYHSSSVILIANCNDFFVINLLCNKSLCLLLVETKKTLILIRNLFITTESSNAK